MVVYGLQLSPEKLVATGLSPTPTWLSAMLAIFARETEPAGVFVVGAAVGVAVAEVVVGVVVVAVAVGVAVAAVVDGESSAVDANAGCARQRLAISAPGTIQAASRRRRVGGGVPPDRELRLG